MARLHRTVSRLSAVTAVSMVVAAGIAWMSTPAAPAYASDPMGVYSLVQDVQYEPDKLGSERIRIYGIHALSYRPKEGPKRNHGLYTEPKAGYLYFTCPPSQTETCRMEWADLEKAIGDDRCAAFGDRYLTDPEPNGRLRDASEPPADPDTYPKGQGVTMAEHGWDNTCDAIREAAAALGTPAVVPPAETPIAPPVEPLPPAADADGSFLPKVDGDKAAGDGGMANSGSGSGSGSGSEGEGGISVAGAVDAADVDTGGGAPGRGIPSWMILAVMAGIGAGVVGTAVVLSRGHRP